MIAIGGSAIGNTVIDYKTADFNNKLTSLKTTKNIVKQGIDQINGLINGIQAFWTGAGAAIIRAAFILLKQKLEKLDRVLQENITALEDVQKMLIEADNKGQQSGNNIRSQVQQLKITNG